MKDDGSISGGRASESSARLVARLLPTISIADRAALRMVVERARREAMCHFGNLKLGGLTTSGNAPAANGHDGGGAGPLTGASATTPVARQCQ